MDRENAKITEAYYDMVAIFNDVFHLADINTEGGYLVHVFLLFHIAMFAPSERAYYKLLDILFGPGSMDFSYDTVRNNPPGKEIWSLEKDPDLMGQLWKDLLNRLNGSMDPFVREALKELRNTFLPLIFKFFEDELFAEKNGSLFEETGHGCEGESREAAMEALKRTPEHEDMTKNYRKVRRKVKDMIGLMEDSVILFQIGLREKRRMVSDTF